MGSTTFTRSEVQPVSIGGTVRGIAKAIMQAVPFVTSIEVTEGVGSATYKCVPPLDATQREKAIQAANAHRPAGTLIDVV